MQPGTHDEDEKAEREVRVALVLYGGVSLAIYENGVARCFDSLVRREGVFEIVLRILRARARVDVIAGTSAGGINGLILAACLESGSDFKSTAALWRSLGDFGSLLRPVRDADRAESLLDGEGYYHRELLDAFRSLCKPVAGWKSRGEIDLFVTGTDVDGHERRYQDSLGANISDKEHRLVFHLKHRPERAWLGLVGAKRPRGDKGLEHVDGQAAVLAAVARITSSFPIAFPPFRAAQLGRHGQTVAESLRELSRVDGMDERWLVDGGVLDNKPFGPVLEAIYYRMPTIPVQRRLFYVEPDPVPFLEKGDPTRGTTSTPPPSRPHSPLQIAGASLSTIPAHEGIGNDLDQLLEHNQRVRWLSALRTSILEDLMSGRGGHAGDSAQYRRARLEGLARLLVLETDAAPSARDYPRDARRSALLDAFRGMLMDPQAGIALATLDQFDVGFHQRVSFGLLYALHDAVDKAPSLAHLRGAMWKCGRVIKALEIVYAAMIELRDQLVPRLLDTALSEGASLWGVLLALRRLLAVDADHWTLLLQSASRGGDDFLDRETLTKTLERARNWIGQDRAKNPADSAETTILGRLAEVLASIGDSCKPCDFRMQHFIALDQALYPLEFTSGIHELDEIRFVRVSPGDAQVGLSRRPADEKVAGDELAHFSSFLRRDWRSNDLLYGSLDGICQIIRSLLDDGSLDRAVGRELAAGSGELPSCAELFTTEARARLLPQCTQATWGELIARWQALLATNAGTPERLLAAEKFREALIVAGQEDASERQFEGVLADHCFQEIAYGRQQGPGGTTSESSPTAIELDAEQFAHRAATRLTPGERWRRFLSMRLGGQPVAGARGGVPNNVIGEYVTAVYLLLWGVLTRSLGNHGGLLDLGRVRFLFRTPVAFFHHLFTSLRTDRRTALVSALLGLGVLVGFGVAAWQKGEWSQVGAMIAIAIVGFAVLTPDGPRWRRYAALAVVVLVLSAVYVGRDAAACLGASTGDGECGAIQLDGRSVPPLLALEFARSPSDIDEITGGAQSPKRAAAGRVLHADFLFIAAYTLLFLAVAMSLWSTVGRARRMALAAAMLCILAAAFFDVWENVRLLSSLQGGAGDWFEQRAGPLLERLATIAGAPARSDVAWAAVRKWAAFFVALLLSSVGFLCRNRGFALLTLLAWLAAGLGIGGLLNVPEGRVPDLPLWSVHWGFELALLLAVCFVLTLLLGNGFEAVGAAGRLRVDPVWRRRTPLLFAHRGGRLEVPESTTRACRHALETLRVDVLEIDVQLTADDELVVWHGPELTNVRIDGVPSKRRRCQNDIRKYKWGDLCGKAWVADPDHGRDLDTVPKDDDRRLLLLAELLQQFPDANINIELKSRLFGGRIGRKHVPALVKILDTHRYARTILVACGRRSVLKEFRERTAGRYPTGLALVEVLATMVKAGLGWLPPGSLAGRALQTSHAGWLSPRWLIDSVRAAGGATHVFLTGFPLTFNLEGTDPGGDLPAPQAVFAVLDRGADGLMTDRPTCVGGLIELWRKCRAAQPNPSTSAVLR